MATKTTMTSTDPAFKKFNTWFADKIAEFEANGNTASIEQFNNAYNAKSTSNTAAGATFLENEDGSIIQTNNVIVPEFNVVYDQWVSQYNVQFTSEEV
jgi:hypothetical protein